MLTGEPVPAEVGPGDAVTGGCVNAGGRLVVRATRVGADTQLAQMARLVEPRPRPGKAPVQRLADRISAVFVPVVIGVAVVTLAGWLAAGQAAGAAFTAAVAVLIIACPCAMGLATPTAILVGTGRGAQLGIVIKGPEVLESTRAIDTIVLDKTGTVTTGRMSLADVVTAAPALTPAEAAAAGRGSGGLPPSTRSPPRSRPAPGTGSARPARRSASFANARGLGVSGVVDGHAVAVGRAGWLESKWALADPGRARRARPRSGGGRAAPPCSPAGTGRSAACWSSPTRSSPPRRRRSPAARHGPAAGAAHRRQRPRRPRRRRRRSASAR